MDNLIKNNNSVLVMENQKSLKISGVSKVLYFSKEKIGLLIGEKSLEIGGQNLETKKFADGNIEIYGDISTLRYDAKKQGFFKRLFKWLFLKHFCNLCFLLFCFVLVFFAVLFLTLQHC